ncbi:GntR family transcriptional regulator [Nocardia sp. CA2R105]|uniref:GntR family transcriptional regulator n=1 Tax=Nocardia coffeae TaxID=2873381 RepID=UPI001CA60A74|nr:GntR family transcriptional regulator [Nocardia coffeae]MBY8861192.1 GntR family transcriptional regulator [Nocardia coffeae]
MTGTRNGRQGRTPVYRQVERELLRRIRDRELLPGERLPTEPELAAEWGINRLTIRQAVAELARAGYVTVRQGSGTYVAEPPMVIDLALPSMPSTDADAGSTAAIAETVEQNQTETLIDLTDRDTAGDAAEALDADGPFTRIDTLIHNGNQPFMVASYWIETRRVPGFTAQIAERVPMFQILQQRYDLRLRHSWRSLTATLASTEDAALLEVPPGSPVMLRCGVNVDADGVPTMYLRRRLRGDRIRFMMHYDTD